ncbi:MAG TPA: phosphatase PAP2 family protein [Thermoanaerobaculia bacterium]
MKRRRSRVLAALACAVLAVGCASVERPGKPGPVPEVWPGFLAGYLPPEAVPNSLLLVPPPPAAGSAALALDEETNRKVLALRGTLRFALAAEDANLMFPRAAGVFSCSLNAPVTEQDTPRLYLLLRRVLGDAGASTGRAKNEYKRPRPFLVNKEPTCTPGEEPEIGKQGSYPSGHSAAGWAWALVLAEAAPNRADAILARGRAFGQSRVVCNVHWQADVNEGRTLGAATVARLHADPGFRADLEAARQELAAVRARGLKPVRDCGAEAAALAGTP